MRSPAIYALLCFILFFACRRDVGVIIPADACDAPAVVSFSQDLQPLFSQYCALSGCHVGPSPQGNLNLEPGNAYNQLMNPQAGFVDTIHPQYSLVYAQMTSASTPMPPTGNLDNCKINLVLKWIQQKAKNN